MIDDWDIELESLTLDMLNRTINIGSYQGLVLTKYYNKSDVSLGLGLNMVETEDDVPSLVLAWKEEGSIDIYVVHIMLNEENSKPKNCGRNTTGHLVPKKDFRSEYSVGMDYKYDDVWNGSLTDE
ncbi:hypothetical protein ACFE04_000778 [Oxalis oulophora]